MGRYVQVISIPKGKVRVTLPICVPIFKDDMIAFAPFPV
jgi:hypothetical protein